MNDYRIKPPRNGSIYEDLEGILYLLGSIACTLAGGLFDIFIGGGLALLILAAFGYDRYTRIREISLSAGTVKLISRKQTQTLALTDFCGIATFTETRRSKFGNYFLTALVPAKPYGKPLLLGSHGQWPGKYNPAVDAALRHNIAAATGLPDFGDVGNCGMEALYAQCHGFQSDSDAV